MYLVSVHDSRTGFTLRSAIPDHGKQTASLMAFAGARFSRSDKSTEDIFHEILEAGSNAQEKLANIFRNYGHASVADMANLFVYIENVPKHYEARFFNETSIGGGQARSSRYQDFGNGTLYDLKYYFPDSVRDPQYAELNQDFIDLQKTSIGLFNTWKEKVKTAYIDYYGIDTQNKREVGALTARVFDTARGFLFSGINTRTSIAWITNAREWARIIGAFKGSQDTMLTYLGEHIEALLAPDEHIKVGIGYVPEAPDLIKYTGADESGKNIKQEVKKFLQAKGFELYASTNTKETSFARELKAFAWPTHLSASQKVILQQIIKLYPSIDLNQCVLFLHSLDDDEQRELGQLVFEGFDHHTQMDILYRVNSISFDLQLTNAEAIDLNRHRAWGRFSPLWSSENDSFDCISNGYIAPLYLSEVAGLRWLYNDFQADMDALYSSLQLLLRRIGKLDWFENWLIPQMLPLAHNARLQMHGSIKELSYMSMLRVRPGGHINYRDIAWQIAELGSRDPLLSSLAIADRPDPSSRTEFVDRS